MKTIYVELTGAPGAIAGRKEIILQLPPEATYRDVVQRLAEAHPGLVGVLIAADKRSFLSANLFSRTGQDPVMPDLMDGIPPDGEQLVVVFFIVGG
jgi:hypothetical protein